jgi:formate-dependent nitrite reductase membrane component NrfD
VGKHAPLWNTALGVLQIASGVVASGALLCLAVYNMRVHERTHVRCGLAFFSTNWLQVHPAP